MTHYENVATCPHCGKVNEASTPIMDQEPPGPGDLSICCTCGEPSIFEAGGSVRKMTAQERQDLMDDPTMRRTIMAAQLALAGMRRKP